MLTAAASVAGAGAAARLGLSPPAAAAPPHQHHPLVPGSAHAGFARGNTTVDPKVNGFDPTLILRDFDWGKTHRLAAGHVLREWELVAYDKEIEIVPGVKYAAWTYNGRVPGPTLRAREGDRLRIHFVTPVRIPTRSTSTGFIRPSWTERRGSARRSAAA